MEVFPIDKDNTMWDHIVDDTVSKLNEKKIRKEDHVKAKKSDQKKTQKSLDLVTNDKF